MIGYIIAHWIEWVFAAIAALASIGYHTVAKRLKEEHDRSEAIAAGVQGLLRKSIISDYNKYQDKGYCPIYAKQAIKTVYEAYHNLGGNDVATSLYHKLLDMPEEPNDEQ